MLATCALNFPTYAASQYSSRIHVSQPTTFPKVELEFPMRSCESEAYYRQVLVQEIQTGNEIANLVRDSSFKLLRKFSVLQVEKIDNR